MCILQFVFPLTCWWHYLRSSLLPASGTGWLEVSVLAGFEYLPSAGQLGAQVLVLLRAGLVRNRALGYVSE